MLEKTKTKKHLHHTSSSSKASPFAFRYFLLSKTFRISQGQPGSTDQFGNVRCIWCRALGLWSGSRGRAPPLQPLLGSAPPWKLQRSGLEGLSAENKDEKLNYSVQATEAAHDSSLLAQRPKAKSIYMLKHRLSWCKCVSTGNFFQHLGPPFAVCEHCTSNDGMSLYGTISKPGM